MPTYRELNDADLRDWVVFLHTVRSTGGNVREVLRRRMYLSQSRQGYRRHVGRKIFDFSGSEVM